MAEVASGDAHVSNGRGAENGSHEELDLRNPAGQAAARRHDRAADVGANAREILLALRRLGSASPDRIATELGGSRTGILQQLHALEASGLVRHATVRHGVGRPRHVYETTAEAQSLFPSDYDSLASGLVAALEQVGGEELVRRVFETRSHETAERIRTRLAERLPAGASLADRVRELAVIQDEQGYLCRARVDPETGMVRLDQHNCAIFHVATGIPAACESELRLLGEVLDADVVRESHIAAGDSCCGYRIQPRANGHADEAPTEPASAEKVN